MPIFNFKCQGCYHEFEELVMKETEVVECPECGISACDRQFTGGSSFVLKGGGWEADGYATVPKKDTHGKPGNS